MFLDAELATIALCWRIERRDGVAVGLTAHDRDLVVDGLVHRAAPGMTPSAIQRSEGLEADTMDVAGALTSSAIGEGDLLAGRWDGARVRVFAPGVLAPSPGGPAPVRTAPVRKAPRNLNAAKPLEPSIPGPSLKS